MMTADSEPSVNKLSNVENQSTAVTVIDHQPTEETNKHAMLYAAIGGLTLIVFGFAEGVTFAACGIVSPSAVRGQFVFKVWIVMKMFLAAVGTSMLLQSGLSLYNPKKFEGSRSFVESSAGLVRIVLGATTLGVGMALAGSGPSIVAAQLGAGVTYAAVTIGGLVLGGLVYAAVETILGLRTDLCLREGQVIALDKLFNVPYAALAAPMGIMMIGGAVITEALVSSEEDASRIHLGRVPPLYPLVTGVVVGLNQFPIRLISGKGQGASTSVVQIIATVTGGKLFRRFKVDSIQKASQILFIYVGTTLGSVAASQGSHYDRVDGYAWYYSLIGGFLMMFGGRLANGCACGNGVSGTSELSWHSFIAAGCLFGGAIITAFILQAAGADMRL